jgi:glycosyltransferase involved in cell wall biosynthesis
MSGPSTSGPTLGINAERLTGSRAGVGRYLASLLAEWAAADLPFGRVTVYTPAPLPADALPERSPYTVRVLPGSLPGTWEHSALRRAAGGDDVLFCPSYVVPLGYRGRAVVTIHDAIHALLPRSFPWYRRYRSWLYRHSAHSADYVLTDSVAAKRDIERIYDIEPGRVRAIPLGVDAGLGGASEDEQRAVRARYELGEGPLALFVGKLSKRRNLPTLIRAFGRIREGAAAEYKLVLVGSNHLNLPLAPLGEELGLGRSLRLLGHVSDADLRALYAAAEAFVYPSDYEGFGLPVLEAMAAGTPVITLDNSSLREVAGDAAMLLPSATVEGLADAMARLMTDPALREELASLGRARARRFSWRQTADRTMAVLAEAAG